MSCIFLSKSGTFPSAKEKLSTTARRYRKQGKNTSESIRYYWLSERREMPAQNCHQLFPKMLNTLVLLVNQDCGFSAFKC